MSQKLDVLTHLQSGRSLSSLEALELYRIGRLAARIDELRPDHPEIQTRMVEGGNGKRWAEYYIPRFTADSTGQLSFIEARP